MLTLLTLKYHWFQNYRWCLKRLLYVGILSGVGFLTVIFLSGCAIQKTLDSKIYRVDGANGRKNYYRVRVVSSGFNSISNYKTGLYPAYAVDAFLGQEDTLSTVGTDAEREIRESVARAQKKYFNKYLDAFDEDTNDQEIQKAAETLRKLQMFPVPRAENEEYSKFPFVRLEFNPLYALVDHSANKKYVIAFSANPDSILNQISAFSEEAETIKAVMGSIGAFVAGTAGVNASDLKQNKLSRIQAAKELQVLAGQNAVQNLTDLEAIVQDAKTKLEILP